MSDPKEIYLGPACEADSYGDGRTWAADQPWDDCECGHKPVRYVRADIHDALAAERDALRANGEIAAEKLAQWDGIYQKLLDQYDALAARLAEAERDAARYRWLRRRAWPFSFAGDKPEDADAAIDEAMAASTVPRKHTKECSYWDGLMAQVCNCGASTPETVTGAP